MPYKVKEVADMIGVSVRTLHHYDKIGLLKPEYISPAGYRLYTDNDLERLQQILFFKEIDFNLQEIKDILDSPGFDRKRALTAHKELLIEKRVRLNKIIKSVENTLYSIEGDIEMNKNEMFDAFDMSEIKKHQEKYAEEARQKYGDTDPYKESQKKTSRYTKEDWAVIMAEQDENYKKIRSLMDKGPADPEVQKAIRDKRQHITDYYYNCTPEIFRGLGEMYVNDPRFTANIDKYGVGLAKFMQEAMQIYCDNLEK
ncbi:MAG: MerR family transcriptional regulator [Firmicutes bacterium HGW-Firmicutes-15]|nr:MAG: MerR family transcriptional regulator [Firmicutes bacterium HGW-Firmicutes-15]